MALQLHQRDSGAQALRCHTCACLHVHTGWCCSATSQERAGSSYPSGVDTLNGSSPTKHQRCTAMPHAPHPPLERHIPVLDPPPPARSAACAPRCSASRSTPHAALAARVQHHLRDAVDMRLARCRLLHKASDAEPQRFLCLIRVQLSRPQLRPWPVLRPVHERRYVPHGALSVHPTCAAGG